MSAAEKKPKAHSDEFYRRIYTLFRPIFKVVCYCAYGVWVKHPVKYSEPVLILANHTSDLDFLVVAEHIKNHMYFVSSEHVTAMGLFGWGFRHWFNPITVTKGSSKVGGVVDIMRRIRRGNCVLLFCEGRISHNGKSTYIAPATAKLAKKLGCKVVTFRSKGGYFIEPRWQNYLNSGKLFEHGIVHEYSPEELADMSAEEVLAHIREDLYVDAYAEQEKYMRPFKFRHGVRDIIRYYDTCPRCGGIDTLTADEQRVKCSCGWELTMDEYGFFHEPEGKIRTAADWEQLQLANYRERFERGEVITEPDVTLSEVGEGFVLTELAQGTLAADAATLSIGGMRFPLHELTLPEILSGGRKLEFTCGKRDFMLQKEGACLNKFVELYKWTTGSAE